MREAQALDFSRGLLAFSLFPRRIAVAPAALVFLAEVGTSTPLTRTLAVQREGCGAFSWSASDDAAWLQTQVIGDAVQVSADPSGLATGTYTATVTIDAGSEVLGSPARVPWC